MSAPELVTERLLLRHWQERDHVPFAALNADPAVMEHFPAPLSRAQSDALVDREQERLTRDAFGLWAVEVWATGAFAGFVGLAVPPFVAHFTPAVEVGWRLGHEHWGRGYATEGARAALAHGFGTVGLGEVVSFTATVNARSIAVMERLGMHHDPRDDFDHPAIATGHRLRRHVLYRLPAPRWRELRAEPPPRRGPKDGRAGGDPND